jgi:hypothetical protein
VFVILRFVRSSVWGRAVGLVLFSFPFGCLPSSHPLCYCLVFYLCILYCIPFYNHIYIYRVQKYLERLTAKTKPKKILVCMIYYPDETDTASWAGPALGLLGYNHNPAKLQLLIRRAFTEATSYVQYIIYYQQ